jgi:MFS transporter, MHS family, alpha-ketoglutarate permease
MLRPRGSSCDQSLVDTSEIFFPHGNQTAQLLNASAVAAFGYVARPLGSLLMGRYADRNGCRAALALSISLMCGGPSWSR